MQEYQEGTLRNMDKKELIYLLRRIEQGEMDIHKAADLLSTLYYEDIGFAKIDYDRKQRTGYPEIIYCDGKSAKQINQIIARMNDRGDNILGTRLSQEKYEYLQMFFPYLQYDPNSRMMWIENQTVQKTGKGKVAIVTGGTSDISIAEEAAITAEFFGNDVMRIYDVGIAGLKRLLDHLDLIREARVIVAIAGMEGALPSVLAGLVKVPIIAVPTSVGYGANFAGLSALLAMLNSCAPGLSVVNIDNGFGAGHLASTINHL